MDKWIKEIRGSDLCETQFLFKLKMKGGAEDNPDFFPEAVGGKRKSENEEENRQR